MLKAASEQRQVLVMPLAAPAAPATEVMAGMPVEVSAEGDFLVYRVHHDGRTHTAYNPVDGTGRWLAFDPEQGRFNEVASSLLVRMPSFDDLEALIDRSGALGGKAYPALGWALLRMPKRVNPAEAAQSLTSDPSVKGAELLLRTDVKVPMRVPPTGDSWHLPEDSQAAGSFAGLRRPSAGSPPDPSAGLRPPRLGLQPAKTTRRMQKTRSRRTCWRFSETP